MADSPGGRPLQLVTLNMEERKVEVNEEALGHLQKNLKKVSEQTEKVAVISVMGAFRTGKSFLLDLFLRNLRYEKQLAGDKPAEPAPRAAIPPRGGEETYPLPEWVLHGGDTIEGGSDHCGGFRFKGGMDHCTEGIWVWSEPFVRKVNGKPVALLLMDTQGAWGGEMSKEQSATIFGLTAVISSKQIYNISMQIQQDKVENLAYFMNFAEEALRKADDGNTNKGVKPFQTLDFLVRDWANFEDEWTMQECKAQMAQHLTRHVDPKSVVENGTAEAMQNMFDRIGCFCMPHPGTVIQKAKWTGNVRDISPDFIRFLDEYVQEVFTTGLDVKTLLGQELSATTLPYVLRDFVKSFQDATPVAMSFVEAMTNATVLMTKEKLLKLYTKKLDEEVLKHPRGIEPEEFQKLHRSTSQEIQAEFKSATILGSSSVRTDTWQEIENQIKVLQERYLEDNSRRLEQALVAFANLAILATALFALDRISDWTCDWWSQTCKDLSSLMLMAYFLIFCYIGFFVWRLVNERGKMQAAACGAEMWKEMVRLVGVYGEILQNLKFSDVQVCARRSFAAVQALFKSASARDVNVKDSKKNK